MPTHPEAPVAERAPRVPVAASHLGAGGIGVCEVENQESRLGTKRHRVKNLVLIAIGCATLLCALNSAFAERKELGALDRGGVEGILKQFGYGWLSVESAHREDEDDKKDGAGYRITAKCKNKDKVVYDAVLWVTKRWDKGRVISVKKKSD